MMHFAVPAAWCTELGCHVTACRECKTRQEDELTQSTATDTSCILPGGDNLTPGLQPFLNSYREITIDEKLANYQLIK
jgi:hypothetical protein